MRGKKGKMGVPPKKKKKERKNSFEEEKKEGIREVGGNGWGGSKSEKVL